MDRFNSGAERATRLHPADREDSSLLTPLPPWDLFVPHVGRPFAYFLDRAGSESWSFAGSAPQAQLVVRADGRAMRVDAEDGRALEWRDVDADPIDALAQFVEDGHAGVRAEPFADDVTLPRTVGYLAYELGRFTEDVRLSRRDPLGMPLAILSRYDELDAWHPHYGLRRGVRFRRSPVRRAAPRLPPIPRAMLAAPSAPLPERVAEPAYRRGFERISAAIRAGEIYQANLSRRIDVELAMAAPTAYRRLRSRQPVPFGAYLDLGGWQILSNSPECFLRVDGDRVRTWPIKGTRARTARDRDADRREREALVADPKEMAEHIMIVDLERNDLGRVCEIGSVAVARQAFVQTFRTLHHLVSEVRGRLRADCDLATLLRATFPGGSITGAPKIRAMEIIDEVEPIARGVYTGAIGAFNGARSIDLNIAIRTAVAAGGRVSYSTGGGIVADSRLASEHDETVTKARAFLDVVGDHEHATT